MTAVSDTLLSLLAAIFGIIAVVFIVMSVLFTKNQITNQQSGFAYTYPFLISIFSALFAMFLFARI